MSNTMNAFLASSTWTRVAAVLLGLLSAAHAAGLLTDVTPEMITEAADQAAIVVAEGSKLWEALFGLAGTVGLWSVADAQRSVGSKDLTIGTTVVSKAGNP